MTVGEFKKYIQENEIHDDVKLLIPGVESGYESPYKIRHTLAMLHADGSFETVKRNQRVWLPCESVVVLI